MNFSEKLATRRPLVVDRYLVGGGGLIGHHAGERSERLFPDLFGIVGSESNRCGWGRSLSLWFQARAASRRWRRCSADVHDLVLVGALAVATGSGRW